MKKINNNNRNSIIESNVENVRKYVLDNFNNSAYDIEELISIANMELVLATYSYDGDMPFINYVYFNIDRKLKEYINEEKKNSNVIRSNTTYNFDEYFDEISDNNVINKVINNLDPKSKYVISLYLGIYDGKKYSIEEIKNITHIRTFYLNKLVYKIMLKIALCAMEEEVISYTNSNSSPKVEKIEVPARSATDDDYKNMLNILRCGLPPVFDSPTCNMVVALRNGYIDGKSFSYRGIANILGIQVLDIVRIEREIINSNNQKIKYRIKR